MREIKGIEAMRETEDMKAMRGKGGPSERAGGKGRVTRGSVRASVSRAGAESGSRSVSRAGAESGSRSVSRAGQGVVRAPTPERGRGVGRTLVYWTWRLALAGVIALALASLPFEVFSEKGFTQYVKLKKELKALKGRNDRLAGDIRRMEREIRSLRDDDVALERVARDELGMIRDGELVFVVEERDWP